MSSMDVVGSMGGGGPLALRGGDCAGGGAGFGGGADGLKNMDAAEVTKLMVDDKAPSSSLESSSWWY
jgi:hypothetical protein